MKPILKRALIQFKTRQETEKKPGDERSAVGKVAAVLGGAAAIGGAGYYWHKNYAKTRTAIQHADSMNRDPEYKAKFVADTARKQAEKEAKRTKEREAFKPHLEAARSKLKAEQAAAPAPKPTKTAAPKPTKTAAPKASAPVKAPAAPARTHTAPKPTPRVVPNLVSVLPSLKGRVHVAAPWAMPKPKLSNFLKSVKEESRAKAKAGWTKATKAAVAPAAKNYVQQIPKGFVAKIKPVQFNQTRHASDGTFEIGTSPFTAYRKASRVIPWVNRASETAGDLGDIATGKKVKDPFYKKSWFKRAAQTAAVAAPLGAYALALKHRGRIAHGEPGIKGGETASKLFGKVGLAAKIKPIQFSAKIKPIQLSAKPNKLIQAYAAHKRLVEFAQQSHALKRSGRGSTALGGRTSINFSATPAGTSRLPTDRDGPDTPRLDVVVQCAGGRSPALPSNPRVDASARLARPIDLATIDPLEKGWDLRDARGRSARVYAPGSRRRDRREKDWGEKTDNIRLVRNAAIATAAGLGGLAIYQGVKLNKLSKPTTVKAKRGAKIAPMERFPMSAAARTPSAVHLARIERRVEEEPTSKKVARWVVPAATVGAAGATIAAALTTRNTAAAAQKSAEAATKAAGEATSVIRENRASINRTLSNAASASRDAKVITGAIATPIRKVKASMYLWGKRRRNLLGFGQGTDGAIHLASKGALYGALAGGFTGATAGTFSAARSGRKVTGEEDLRGVTVARPFAKKAWLPASHVGIGLPNGNIAHVVRNKGRARGEGKYHIVEDTFEKFAGGQTVKARDGVAPKAALRAREAVGENGGCYSTLGKNCEHVVSSIKTGRKEGASKQVERGLAGAAVGAGVGALAGHLATLKRNK